MWIRFVPLSIPFMSLFLSIVIVTKPRQGSLPLSLVYQDLLGFSSGSAFFKGRLQRWHASSIALLA